VPTYGAPSRRHLASSPFQATVATEVETFAIGDRVTHIKHGLGVVVAQNDSTVTLRFESALIRVKSPYDRLTRL
jgi:hypothetical protein